MSENRDRNPSSHLYPFLSTGGVVPYGAGLGVLTAYPTAGGTYRPYLGSHSHQKAPIISPLVQESIKKAGMPIEGVARQARQLLPDEFGFATNPLHFRGNNAAIDAANELLARNRGRISNLKIGLSGGYPANIQPIPNGKGSVQVDLDYLRWDPRSGNTHSSDEIKARNKITGRDQARQAARYGELIAARKASTANARLVGRGLQIGGPVLQVGGAFLDHYLTEQEVERHLAQGNTYDADLARKRLFGRQSGGVLGGAAIGAMLLGGAGAVGGTAVAPGPGTVALGTGGVLLGGLTGALAGEAVMQRLYDQWNGTSPSGDSRRLARTSTSEHANDAPYPASETPNPASEDDRLFWEWGLR